MKKRRRLVACPACDGAGYRLMLHYDGTEHCPTCKGKKRVTQLFADLYHAKEAIDKAMNKEK